MVVVPSTAPPESRFFHGGRPLRGSAPTRRRSVGSLVLDWDEHAGGGVVVVSGDERSRMPRALCHFVVSFTSGMMDVPRIGQWRLSCVRAKWGLF